MLISFCNTLRVSNTLRDEVFLALSHSWRWHHSRCLGGLGVPTQPRRRRSGTASVSTCWPSLRAGGWLAAVQPTTQQCCYSEREWEASPVGCRRISFPSVMSTLGPDCSPNGFSMMQTLLLNFVLLNADSGCSFGLESFTAGCYYCLSLTY